MSDLLIHCGLHKTGSSAFQAWLMRNAGPLAERGLHMPVKLSGPKGNAANLALHVLTQPQANHSKPNALRRQAFIKFCRASDGPVIISAEDFESRLQCVITEAEINVMMLGQEKALAKLGQRAAAIRQAFGHLRATAAEAGRDRIRLAFVLRNRADKLASSFAQRSKQLSQAVLPSGPFIGDRFFAPHAVLFRLLEAEGAEVRVGRVGQHPGGIAPLVCDLLGIGNFAQGLDPEIGEVNSSIGEVGVVVALGLRAQMTAHGLSEDRKLRFKLSRLFVEVCAGLKDRGFDNFSSAGLLRFQAGQARLDAQLSDWLAPDDIAALGKTRLTGAASPLDRKAFSPEQEVLARDILGRLRAAVARSGLDLPFTIGEPS